MLKVFSCKSCGTKPVSPEVFESHVDPRLLPRVRELEKDPTVEILELAFENGCTVCRPTAEHGIKVLAIRDKGDKPEPVEAPSTP